MKNIVLWISKYFVIGCLAGAGFSFVSALYWELWDKPKIVASMMETWTAALTDQKNELRLNQKIAHENYAAESRIKANQEPEKPYSLIFVPGDFVWQEESFTSSSYIGNYSNRNKRNNQYLVVALSLAGKLVAECTSESDDLRINQLTSVEVKCNAVDEYIGEEKPALKFKVVNLTPEL